MSDETIVKEAQESMMNQTDETETGAETNEAAPLSLEAQLAAAQEEAVKNLDGWLRTQAEFANARKRLEKQRAEAYANATGDVIAKLLPVMDDFERAIGSVPSDVASVTWFEGIQLVHRKLNQLLEQFNVVAIEAVGQTFDPNLHEALSQEPSDQFSAGTVTRVLQKGYKVGERIIRPSLVYVAE